MINDTFANRLKEALRKNNMKASELAAETGLDKSLISNYLSGNYKAKQDKLTLIAKILKVNEMWLMGYDVPDDCYWDRYTEKDGKGFFYFNFNKNEQEELNQINFDNAIIQEDNDIIQIPVYGTIKAGIPIESQDDITEYIDISKKWASGNKKFYGLKISGDSMSPKYNENDIVIFEQNDDKELWDGKDVAVMINGTEATFKKILVNDQGIILQPYNLNYDMIMFTKEQVEELPVRVVGIAREKRTRID